MPKNIHLNEFVLFQLQRNIVNLYKKYIILTEDLRRDHSVFLRKLKEAGVSEELLNKLDYFDDEKYTYIRKKVLDSGNELNRELEKYFGLIELKLNGDKLDEVQKTRLSELMNFNKKTQLEKSGDKFKVKGKII